MLDVVGVLDVVLLLCALVPVVVVVLEDVRVDDVLVVDVDSVKLVLVEVDVDVVEDMSGHVTVLR